MKKEDAAIQLSRDGFYVFPLEVNGKKPLIMDFPNKASRDPVTIQDWWRGRNYNIGIYTGKFRDNEALVVVDVDDKAGKNGSQTLLSLDMDGKEFPKTMEQSTPSGGRHLIYQSTYACKQGVEVLGNGLDIRSHGGYIVAPGSEIDGKPYALVADFTNIKPAPDWLINRLGKSVEATPQAKIVLPGIDPEKAEQRAIKYLNTLEPTEQGSRNDTGYRVAVKLKDLGCSVDQTFSLMLEHWDVEPALPLEELEAVVHSAFKYGKEPQGAAAPEAIFPPVEDDGVTHPVHQLNCDFCFIKTGAFILQETTDHKHRYTTHHLSPFEFNKWFANKKITIGKKTRSVSEEWMEWEDRRQFDGVVFAPSQDMGSRWFNLWRGFTVEPAETSEHPSVRLFLEHALTNVCANDQKLFGWLMAYFAHAIQRPWEKPLVALVFKGNKGTGKNALLERFGSLLGPHFLVADDSRYLLSSFNSHLESCLFFVLDEACWAGDKHAEGKLKGLITGSQHNIERKGAEPYRVDNLTRVAIIGNEDWLVPASQDERRFAVFNVGNGRLQDREFFKAMRVGMEQGGYRNLLRYFMDYDISKFDVNDAPKTEGLFEQKVESLEPISDWWYECLMSNSLVGGDFEGDLPREIPSNRLMNAFMRRMKARNVNSRIKNESGFFKAFKKFCPHYEKTKVSRGKNEPTDSTYRVELPDIDQLREAFNKHMGHEIKWEH